jgi:FKBP-type peptidyl-prolyl cis-trans isomerase FkpA
MPTENDVEVQKAKPVGDKRNSTVIIITVLISIAALVLIFWPRNNEYKYNEDELFTKPSGVKYKELTIGKGDQALLGKTVVVKYTGYLTDGTKFDSSADQGKPLEFTLGKGEVIEGFDDGVFGMKVGGKRQLVIPPEVGYGEAGSGKIPPNATLVFVVKLEEVK